MNQNCPCCDNHCPKDQLGCSTGRQHFGIEEPKHAHAAGHPANSDDTLIVLLRKCGHFLHHNIGRDGDTAPLLNALSPDERKTLEALLEKCIKNWQQL